MTRRLSWLLAALSLAACGPTIPDNADHRNATSRDCAFCHFETGEGRTPPEDHWEEGDVEPGHEGCFRCHAWD